MSILAYLTDFDDSECLDCGDVSGLYSRRECVWYENQGDGSFQEHRSFRENERCSRAELTIACSYKGPCGTLIASLTAEILSF